MNKVLIILIFLSFLFFPGLISAQASSPSAAPLKQEAINPDSIFYPVKRLWEKAEGYLASFNHDRAQKFEADLANIRLSELEYIAQNNKYNEFKDASSRYVTLLQQQMASKNKLTEPGKQIISEQVLTLKQLQQKYSGDYAYWSFLQQAIETSQKYLSQ